MPPNLFRVLIPSSDIEESTAFYSAILGMDGTRVSPGRHYFDCSGTILACFDPAADGDGRSAIPNPEHINIAVDNLEAIYERCRAAGAAFDPSVSPGTGPLGRISLRPWGERSFYVFDPTGNPICFVDQVTVFRGS